MLRHAHNWPLKWLKHNPSVCNRRLQAMEKAILFKAEKLDNLLVFKAMYKHFQFSRHIHEDFALGVMERGAQKIHCGGSDYCALPSDLITVNAGEVHDGKSADGGGFHYKIIYIPPSLLEKVGREMVSDDISPIFSEPVTVDSVLASHLRHLFNLLEESTVDMMQVQTEFYSILAAILKKHGVNGNKEKHFGNGVPDSIVKACVYIHDMACTTISLDDIASAAGLSRFHFLRVFTSCVGITPYSYLLQQRLQLARQSLRQGNSIADAAYHSCFADQAHFSRRFKSAFGITPRQYQKALL